MNSLIDVGLGLLATLAFLIAVYEGRCWAHRKPDLSKWLILRPDSLFRPAFYTDRGTELRRTAIRFLVAFGVVGILLIVGILYRNWLEHAA